MAKQKTVKKSTDRGKFLTIILIILLLLNIYWIYLLITNTDGSREDIVSGPTWILLYHIILFFVDWASLYGLWKFKKWGVYLFVGSVLSGLGVMVFDPAQEPMSVPMQIAFLVFVAIIVGIPMWAIKRKWYLFK